MYLQQKHPMWMFLFKKTTSTNTKKYSKLFRFPGLCYDADDIQTTTKLGYMVIGGDVFGNDGFQKNPQTIIYHILSSVKPGSIIVLHMMGGPNAPRTSDALSTIIQKLRKDGYKFVTVSELLKM